jgi:carbon-monoxide dehydrogenase medium subunit
MISREFDYHLPSTLEEASSLLANLGGDAVVLGGGTMLVPSMTQNKISTGAIIGLTALNLDMITLENDHVCIGAMTSYADLLRSSIIADKAPLLRIMAGQITGGPSILNQGTVGGSAAFANPASDVPACLSALEATFELQSVAGIRLVAASDFIIGAFRTARRPDELLSRIHIPLAAVKPLTGYYKYKFCASSWPIVTAACVIHRGAATTVHVSVGAAATRPTLHIFSIGIAEVSRPDSWVESVAEQMAAGIEEEWTDELADGRYRRAIVPAVVKRSLLQALEGMPV